MNHKEAIAIIEALQTLSDSLNIELLQAAQFITFFDKGGKMLGIEITQTECGGYESSIVLSEH